MEQEDLIPRVIDTIKLLLRTDSEGAAVNAQDHYRYTLFPCTTRPDGPPPQVGTAQHLLGRGADLRAINTKGDTATA